MKKIIVLSISFFVAIGLVVHYTPQSTIDKTTKRGKRYLSGPAEFAKFHQDIRTAEGESKPGYRSGYKLKELRKAKELSQRFSARAKSNGVTAWTERGPANVPGRTRGLIVDPDDVTKNTWFAGSVGGGVWKTTNAGQSWTNKTPDLPNLSTGVLAMDASNSNIIYIGTGEGFFNLDAIDGTGIFKSTDKGETWSLLNSTINFPDVNRIVVTGDIVVAATNNGIYRSVDGGNVWTKSLDEPLIQDLKVNPANFNIQYATQNSVGVWKSTNSGTTWNLTALMGAVGRIEIAVSPVNPNKIFASAEKESSGDGSKLLMTSNGGDSWSFVEVKINNTEVDFLGGAEATDGQGWYDNTIACDPFNENIIYYGGIDMFRTQVGSSSGTANELILDQINTDFISLVNFSNTNGVFDVGSSSNNTSIELRFGPGQSQKAHRFLVPEGTTSGVAAEDYTYQNYVDVPFTAWDVTANPNRQLMVSFRDQGRNGIFDLIAANTTSSVATEQSREYIFINNVDYNATTPSNSIVANKGHEFNEMYNIWPTLTAGETWPPSSTGTLRITLETFTKVSSTTTNITNGRGTFGNTAKNAIVHVDHHNIVMVPMTVTTYKIINANDGGVFVSNTSATPGINNGNWTGTGNGYNSSQFYGADKKTGADQYFGGMQDNGTWLSPAGQNANATTNYIDKISGDGFEVIWHNTNTQLLIGGSQGNRFARSTNGGGSFVPAISGLGPESEMPFISKLANSRALPDRIFTLGLRGVFVSDNFGQQWRLTPITQKWGSSSVMDIEVSRANAHIVWAGLGMTDDFNLHVSTDGGVEFKTTNNYTEVSMGSITKLASHPTEPLTAYALFSLAGKPKILKTTNLGDTWADISGFGTNSVSASGFPDVAVYCLYIRPDDTNIIWAGTEIGIVESQDGGATWTLLDDFPNVSVWDMKGVDDEIVIATHGRGIWTASVGVEQIVIPENLSPTLSAVGTDPAGNLALLIEETAAYDSLRIYIDNQYVGTIDEVSNAEEIVVSVSGLQKGVRTAYAIAYEGGIPYATNSQSGELLTLKPIKDSYSDYFSNLTNFKSSGFSLQVFSGQSTFSRKTLQTAHPYPANTTATSFLLVPITIKTGTSTFNYRDVAIVEPENDSVVVEATKDGVHWIALAPAYDATSNISWLTAYNATTPNNIGKYDQMVSHTIDLLSKFAAGDKVLFRFRLSSNATVNAWGWAIDYVAIQEEPTEAEYAAANSVLSLYPNPTTADATLVYTLLQPGDVSIELMSTEGKRVIVIQKGNLPVGEYSERIKTTNLDAGIYVVILRKADSTESIRLVVK